SPGAIAEAKEAVWHIVPRPGTPVAASKTASTSVGAAIISALMRWGIAAIAVLLLLLIGLRHPFIMQRLLIMIPTLLVVSVAVFIIIQLPPGDFLTTKIIQYQESGDAIELKQLEDLKKMFYFEEPAWKQYTRWMGLHWFVTFKPNDTGLIQGNLGRSM